MATVSNMHSKPNLGNLEIPEPIVDLDKITKSIKKMVQNYTQANALVKIFLYLRLWKILVQLKKKLSRFEKKIPLVKLASGEELKNVENIPDELIEMSRESFEFAEIINTHAENTNQIIFRYFDDKIITLVEDIAISMENYAEILALVLNKDFVSEVKRELDSVSVKSPK